MLLGGLKKRNVSFKTDKEEKRVTAGRSESCDPLHVQGVTR